MFLNKMEGIPSGIPSIVSLLYGALCHAYEYFDSLVFGHAELVVLAGGVLCTVFGALPELAVVFTGEGYDVLL